jgi:hypothetical protein
MRLRHLHESCATSELPSIILNSFSRSDTSELKVSYLAGSPKPRIVKLSIKPDGEDFARVGGGKRRAKRFNVHIEIGGLSGAIAPVIGKQPSDIQLWVTDGEVPAFARMQGALFQKGPPWTMILTSPTWPAAR